MTTNQDWLTKVYELDDCVEWIVKNNYRSTSLQFSKDCLEDSSSIALLLKKRTNTDFFISYSTVCCVDYLSIQHLNESTVDSVIYFGSVCLTASKFTDSLPILYVFGTKFHSKESLDFIETSITEMPANNTLILFNTSYALMASEVCRRLESNDNFKGNVSIAKLNSISDKWGFTKSALNLIERKDDQSSDSNVVLGPFSVPNELSEYDLVVHLGQCLSLVVKLNCRTLLEVVVENRTKNIIHADRELRRRVALIEKLKQNSCQTVGVVFTNPLPSNVNNYFASTKKWCRKLKKKAHFLSLMLTVDEYKLGNFPELNAYIIVNSCFCWSALSSVSFCLPVLNWTEFEIASGLPVKYGGIQWNESSAEDLSDSDECQVEDANNQLIQSHVFDKNKWFGLEVNAGDREASVVKSGQKGIASAYDNENVF